MKILSKVDNIMEERRFDSLGADVSDSYNVVMVTPKQILIPIQQRSVVAKR